MKPNLNDPLGLGDNIHAILNEKPLFLYQRRKSC